MKKYKLNDIGDVEVLGAALNQSKKSGMILANMIAISALCENKVVKKYPPEVVSYANKYEKYAKNFRKSVGNNYNDAHVYLKKRLVYDVCMGITGKGVLKGYNKLHKKYSKYIDETLLREIEASLRAAMLDNTELFYI